MRTGRPKGPRAGHRNERGVALAIALLVIVLIGALVTGTFFTGRLEMGSGRNSVYTAQATEAAETGLTSALAAWNPVWNGYAMYGDSVQPSVNPIAGNASVRYTNTVRRMAGGTYLITSRGEKLDGSGNVMATRILATLSKLLTPSVSISAAWTSMGDVAVNGSGAVTGNDFTPAGWSGCAAPQNLPGVRTAGAVGGNHPGGATGAPPGTIQHDGTLTGAMFTSLFNSLLALKTLTITGSSLNGVSPSTTGSPAACNRANPSNWGEPLRGAGSVPQCYDYYPVIYVNSPNFQVNNSEGQGILLVSGNLDLHGNFNFYGLILVMGDITTSGTDNVYGAIMTANSAGGSNSIGGGVAAQYSSCAVQAVTSANATAQQFSERSWVQVNPR